ncbi:MAG: hybrid sensor histidine kinase/response regulator [Ignavibacteriae bacterium]|nr:MAG: hybrid sensor histidine kinase/response regulator [Ignavibacteriota bacterium]
MKILLVDDKLENIDMLEKLLQGNGYETVSAENGVEALAAAKNNPPDMIISDILMPVMDGFTLCREWRKNRTLRKIPFVFYTATYTEQQDEEFALSLGADRFVIKPQETGDFVRIIREVFDAFQSKATMPAPVNKPEEKVFLKEYNETLVRKLEDKMADLEAIEKELKEKNAALEKEIKEQRKIEETLRETQEQLRLLFQSSIDAILLTAPDGTIFSANPSACTILGRTEEEIRTVGRNGIIDTSDPRLAQALAERARTGSYSGEVTMVRKDGTKFPAEISSALFKDREGRDRTSMVFRDITGRKQIEQKLQYSEKRLASIFDTAGDVIFLLDVESQDEYRFASVNQMFLKVTGLPQESIIGKRVRDVIPAQSLDFVLSHYRKAIEERAIVRWEETTEYPNGTLTGEVSIAPVFDDGGNCIHLVGGVHDITQRKQIEIALQRSENQFRMLFDQMTSGFAVHEILLDKKNRPMDYRFLQVNLAFERLTGLHARDIIGKTVLEVLPQTERSFIERYGEVALTGKDIQFESYSQELNKYYFIRAYAPERGKFATVFEDVTERKRAEEILRERDIQFTKLAAQVPGMIYQFKQNTDGSFCVPFTSDGIRHIFGCSPEDVRNDFSPIAKAVLPEDLELLVNSIKTSARQLSPWHCEYRVQLPGQPVRWMDGHSMPEKLNDGSILWHGFNTDITERKQVEEKIQDSEAQFRSLFENSPVGKAMTKIDGSFMVVNKSFCSIVGYSAEELRAKKFIEITYPNDIDLNDRVRSSLLEGKSSQGRFEKRYIHKNGSIVWTDLSTYLQTDKVGNPLYFITTITDITERKQAEEALAKERYHMNMLLDNVPDHIYFKDMESRFIRMNKSQAERFGLKDPADAVGKTDFDFFAEGHARPAFNDEQQIMKTGEPLVGVEEKEIWPNGDVTWVTTTKMPLRDKDGEIIGTFGISKDITSRKKTEEELRRSEEQYRSIFENVQDVYYEVKIDGTILEISPSVEIISHGQYRRLDLIGKSMYDLYTERDIRDRLLHMLNEHGSVADFEITLWNRDGSPVLCSVSAKICYDTEGRPQKIIGSMRDITQRKRAEEALRETRDYLENLLTFTNAPIIVWDPGFKITRFNLAIEKLTGYTVYEVIGKHMEMLLPDESRQSSLSLIQSTADGDHLITVELPILCKNGSVRTVQWSSANIYSADGRTLISTIGQGQDITEQKKLQQELLQSQKMQSIGTLAGGIAHDFNNILGIILGYTSLIERGTLSPDKLHETLGIINNAVGRGAALVGQILTFARKTDVVFKAINVAELIHELLSMLRQTFPKVVSFIEVIDQNIQLINADRTQLHQVLLNLCVNSRDAMPNGGTVTIKAEKLSKEKVHERFPVADQDAYICISVTDTGEGMNEATRRQIFDPFFTTKEQGKGTGLGLAVVYGVVQSHRGFIDVESQVGIGTTFRLYFPVLQASELSDKESLLPESFTTGGSETVLLIEDETALLEIVQLLLDSNGYKVYAAHDGKEAVDVFEHHAQEIDLVLTDMGLPEMTGLDVYKKLAVLRPDIAVIVASGFFEPTVKSELEKIGAKGFIQKPYSPDEVLRKVREVLDAKKK